MKRNSFAPLMLLLAASFVFWPAMQPVQAAKKAKYKVVKVTNGGTLKGKISYQGAAPKTKMLKVTKDNKVCGNSVADESLLVDASGGVANAVVEIEGIAKGKKWELAKSFKFDQKKCAFAPHMILVRPRAKGQVTNSDTIKHNVHTISKNIFNVNKTVTPGRKLKVKKNKIKKSGKIRVQCDLHEWMSGWWIVGKSPYIALSGKTGTFEIKNVPPGKYKVRVWQERLGDTVKEVEIKAGAATRLNVALKGKG